MKNTLNISGKLDDGTISIFQQIQSISKELGIPFVVVGATARDLVMHYGYGVKITRGTGDIDLAINVPSWDDFDTLKQELFKNGFSEGDQAHRIHTATGVPIDIIPFGKIQNKSTSIVWPPDQDFIMSVLGFHESYTSANLVIIQDKPKITISVVSPAGLILLKLISWVDRVAEKRNKDAKDIAYLLENYESLPKVKDRAYENLSLMESVDWDIKAAGAYLLGLDVRSIVTPESYAFVIQLANNELKSLSLEMLVDQMCNHPEIEYERLSNLLNTFFDGFIKSVTSV